jgi:hypothetical protein
MHFVTATVNNKSFLTIDRVPWHGAVPQFVHDSCDFDWFDDGEAKQMRSYDNTVPRRHRTCGIHDKPARGFYLPKKHLVNNALPNRVPTPDEGRQF